MTLVYIVVNELDGLSKGNNPLLYEATLAAESLTSNAQKKSDPVHVQKVADASKDALSFLKSKKHPGVK